MADNVTYQTTEPATPPNGAVIASDDVGGVQYQVVKIDLGGDGASIPVDGTLPVSGPLTDAELRASPLSVTLDQLDTGRAMVQVLGFEGMPFAQAPDGEMQTQDTNLARVLGSNPLVTGDRLKVESTFRDGAVKYDTLNALNASLTYDVSGRAIVSMQVSGTWAGTISFEATLDLTNWLPIAGLGLVAATPAITTTAGGVFRFNCTGIQQMRIRMTAYTSGVAAVTMISSTNTANQFLQQDATYRLVTADANAASLVTALGATNLIAPINRVLPIPPIAFATQTTYTDQKFANAPYIQPRLRVEVAGSQQMPLAQMPATYEMLTRDVPLYRIMEEILLQLMILNGQELHTTGVYSVGNTVEK